MMEDVVRGAVEATVADNPQVVEGWLIGTPKTWGYLAGRAVGAARRRLGRDLTDGERRAVWAALWYRLQQIKQESVGSTAEHEGQRDRPGF
ncbi:MAG: hypothetical protein HW403_703 [Dehalococcoidia bacterium]|nr:hypothetical protein [Dehalococcoidia bacterium]